MQLERRTVAVGVATDGASIAVLDEESQQNTDTFGAMLRFEHVQNWMTGNPSSK